MVCPETQQPIFQDLLFKNPITAEGMLHRKSASEVSGRLCPKHGGPALKWKSFVDAKACAVESNPGVLVITYTVLGVPYYEYSIISPNALI